MKGTDTMSVAIKTADEIAKMRVAGRLASSCSIFSRRMFEQASRPASSTASRTITRSTCKSVIPATLNYAPPGHRPYPASICASVNHVVCHGIPGDKVLKTGDIVNIDVTVIKDGFHGDSSRMFYVGAPAIQAKRLVRSDLRRDVAGHTRGQAGRDAGRRRRDDTAPRREPRLFSGA